MIIRHPIAPMPEWHGRMVHMPLVGPKGIIHCYLGHWAGEQVVFDDEEWKVGEVVCWGYPWMNPLHWADECPA